MTSRQREKASLSLAASGFGLLPWQQLPLPASVGLPVFIHLCARAPEDFHSAVFTFPYMGSCEQQQGFPQGLNQHQTVSTLARARGHGHMRKTFDTPLAGIRNFSHLHTIIFNYGK